MSTLTDRERRIQERFRRRSGGRPRPASVSDDPVVPLSHEQQRLWLAGPHSAAYNSAMRVDLSGEADPASLDRAVAAVVARHSVLRATFHDGPDGAYQRIHEHVATPLRVRDLRDEDVDLAVVEAARQPFDLTAGPVLRVLLLRSPRRSVLVIVVHHLVSDGWFRILFRDLAEAYAGQALPPAGRYADWVHRQLVLADTPAWTRAVTSRADALAGAEPVHLHGDRAGPGTQASGVVPVRVPPEMSRRIRHIAASTGSSPFMVLLTGLFAVVARYARQRDVVLGVPVDTRDHPELSDVMGFFVNLLPVRLPMAAEDTFAGLLRRCRTAWLDGLEHRHVPLAPVLAAARQRGATWTPTVLFNFDPGPDRELRLGDLTGRMSGVDTGIAKVDLNLFVRDTGDGFAGALIHRTSMWSEPAAARFAAHWLTMVNEGLSDPARPLAELLPARDMYPAPPASTRAPRTLTERFREVARRFPDRPAVSHGDRRIAYRDLDAWSDRLARRLLARGVRAGQVVGLCVARSAELVAGLLAILKAGCAYLPLDPAYPARRLALVVDDSSACAVLGSPPSGVGVPVIALDGAADQPAGPPDEPAAPPGSAAYVIHTSGSTGVPKGVVVSHANVDRLLTNTDRWFSFSEHDVWTLFHSYAFDFSVWEIWGALGYGGELVVVPHEISRSPEQFLELLDQRRVTVLNQTPSAFAQLTAVVAARGRGPASLRTIIFGGEALDFAKLRDWYAHVPPDRTRLVNMYGITETTVHVTYRPVTEADTRAGAGSLIGEPIPGLSLHLLDGRGRPVPDGVPGEIHVGGTGLADGYLGDPRRTALRFVPSPHGAGERLYRSGDLACRTGTGELRYLGRVDQQIKLRGFRIELGEVAAALLRHPDVAEAAADLRTDATRGDHLTGYVVPVRGRSAPSTAQLREHLSALLPAHEIPTGFAVLDALPLTPNGKLDRAALPAPARDAETTRVAASDDVERILTEVFAEALDLAEVGATDNFFALGGDSIVAIRVVAGARAAGLRIRAGDVLSRQTPRALVAVAVRPAATARHTEPGVTGPTPMQRWFLDANLPVPAHWNQSVWLGVPRDWSAERFTAAFDTVVRHHSALTGDGLPGGPHAPSQDMVRVLDLTTVPAAHWTVRLGRATNATQTGLDPTSGPLLRALVVAGLPEGTRVLLVAHHLVVDALSWGILLDDLGHAYAGRPLPAATDPAAWFAGHLAAYAHSQRVVQEREFWVRQHAGEFDQLPLDRPDAAGVQETAATVWRELDPEHTTRLLARAGVPGAATVEESLLAAALLALVRRYGLRRVGVDVERHGREPLGSDLDLSRSVGWLTSVFPLIVDTPPAAAELLTSVATALRAVPHRGVGYGALRYLGPPAVRDSLAALPEADVAFNYLGKRPTGRRDGFARVPAPAVPAALAPDRAPASPRGRALSAEAEIVDDRVRLGWTYDGRTRPDTAVALADGYLDALVELVEAGPVAVAAPDLSRTGLTGDAAAQLRAALRAGGDVPERSSS